jgi:hypothetical protein
MTSSNQVQQQIYKLTSISTEAPLSSISEPHGSVGATARLGSGGVDTGIVPRKADHDGAAVLLSEESL